MPHIIVKLYPGRSDQVKKQLTQKIVKNVVEITECKETAVSIAFEEIEPADWAQKVYKSDIIDGPGILYKKPGYNPFELEEKTAPKTSNLMEQVREAARIAEKEQASGDFNAMAWLELELEENPGSFDPFFDREWKDLSESEQGDRAMAIRRVL